MSTVARAEDAVYLFTSFRGNGEDGLRFLYSEDGYDWKNVPGTFLKPRVGVSRLMRDPSLARGADGTFHLVWTTGWQQDQGFGYAHSKDLVHWSEQRFIPVMEHEPTTVNVWAPELFFDEPNKQFIDCWASTIPGRFPDHLEPHDNNQRMYCTTTRDFQEFTPTKLFCDLVISGLVGIVPRADDIVEVDPLLPTKTWDWFCLDGVRYHGHELTIVWDRTGARYGRGTGLAIWANGQEFAQTEALGQLVGKLPNTAAD